MIKKLVTAVGIAAAITLGTAAAANAVYAPEVEVVASDATVAVGEPVTVTALGVEEFETVTFSSDGGTLSSIVVAAAGSSVTKAVANGSASATFVASTPGNYVVSVSSGGQFLGSVTISVGSATSGGGTGGSTGGSAGGSTGGSGGSGLAVTGSEVPAAVIWAGAGAIGLGGIAIAAVAARRRAAAKH